MKSMQKLRMAEIITGLLIAVAFGILAIGGTQLTDHVSLISLIVFISGFIALIFIDSKKRDLAAQIQASKPLVTEMATIVSRRIRHGYRMGIRGGHVSSTDIWCLTFETTRHGAVELAVPWDVWERYKEGVRGELKYKGLQFVRFVKR